MNLVKEIIQKLYEKKYSGDTGFIFSNDDIIDICDQFDHKYKNKYHIVYALKNKKYYPDVMINSIPDDKEWIILGISKGVYRFVISNKYDFSNINYKCKSLIDKTPEIVLKNSKANEQRLLSKIAYNDIISDFLEYPTYRIQSHLKSTLNNQTPVEIDELYCANDSKDIIIPIEVKRNNDISLNQVISFKVFCEERYPNNEIKILHINSNNENNFKIHEVDYLFGNNVYSLVINKSTDYTLKNKNNIIDIFS